VIVGGPWGRHRVILEAITAALAGRPRRVALRAAGLSAEPSLAGARGDALRRLRSAIASAGLGVSRGNACPGRE
jgi:hypothetical protein